MNFKFFDRFTSGLLVGSVSAFLLVMLLDAEVSEIAKTNWVQFATIVAALLAALIALFGVQRQIESQRLSEETKRRAALSAAKAVLPLALTRLIDVAEAGFDFSIKDNAFLRDRSNVSILVRELNIDTEIIQILQDCIRSSDKISSAWISHIISHYQVYRSRLVGSVSDGNRLTTDQTKASAAVDWIVLKAMIEHTYDFARGAETVPEVMDQNLIRAPIGLVLPRGDFSRILFESLTLIKNHYQPMDSDQFSFADR